MTNNRIFNARDNRKRRTVSEEKFIRGLGWDVIRFTDKEVEQDAETVAQAIAKHLQLDYSFSKRQGGGSGMKARDQTPAPPRSLVPRLRPTRGVG